MPLSHQAASSKDQRSADFGVQLQHRHFAFIADVISHIEHPVAAQQAALAFADACAKSNPRFDRERFLKACFAA